MIHNLYNVFFILLPNSGLKWILLRHLYLYVIFTLTLQGKGLNDKNGKSSFISVKVVNMKDYIHCLKNQQYNPTNAELLLFWCCDQFTTKFLVPLATKKNSFSYDGFCKHQMSKTDGHCSQSDSSSSHFSWYVTISFCISELCDSNIKCSATFLVDV